LPLLLLVVEEATPKVVSADADADVTDTQIIASSTPSTILEKIISLSREELRRCVGDLFRWSETS
jgi:hypothetical protein